jgi:hypothetical protein
MAADVSITMEAQNKGVIQAMDQVGKKADQLNRKTQAMGGGRRGQGGQRQSGYTSGMGVLEVSRAIEDAQYGIRGVLNNIPGMIQSFGGSMGLAGVVSIAAVALTVFGKALLNAASGMDTAAEKAAYLEARTKKMAEGFSAMKKKMAADDLAKQISDATKSAEKWVGTFLQFTPDPQSQFGINDALIERTRSATDRMAELNEELVKMQGGVGGGNPIDMEMTRAAEDAARAADLLGGLEEREGIISGMLGEDGVSQIQRITDEIGDLNRAIISTEGKISGSEAALKSLEEQTGSLGTAVKDSLIKTFTNYAPRLLFGRSSIINEDGTVKNPIQSLAGKLDLKKTDELASLEVQKKELANLQHKLEKTKALTAQIGQQKELQEKALKDTQADIDAAKARLEAAQAELATQKALLEKRKEIEAAKLQANIKSNLEGFGVSASDMLSSSGRIGGSVKEYSSAVATVNYQRETLKALKDIARNTRSKKPATYN